MSELLKVTNLTTCFQTESGWVTAVDRLTLELAEGETLALVGESGCGKTQTALAIMRLITPPTGRIAAGTVLFAGRDLLQLPEAEMQSLRGNHLAMIFQEPMTSLNPVLTVGQQIAEVLLRHCQLPRREAWQRAQHLLLQVGIPAPAERMRDYPHQLSGGMRQRVMIAIALACRPELLIADEPTTALDVTIQAQILELLRQLRQELGMALLLITHDLGVVAAMADRVAVMYAGQIVEEATAGDLFHRPQHPYTVGLLSSLPRLEQSQQRLPVIPGAVPAFGDLPSGCRFQARCSRADAACLQAAPELRTTSDQPGRVRCWHPLLEGAK